MHALKSNNSIPRRAFCCALGNESFEPGSKYISHLSSDGKERKDFCPSCWLQSEEYKKKEKGHFWRGKIPKKIEKTDASEEKTLHLFREVYQTGMNPKLLYVLALYLQRRKQLMLLPSGKKMDSLVFELMETGETFSLKPFSLKEEDVAVIFQEIAQLLGV